MMNKGIKSIISIAAIIIVAVGCSSENLPLSDTLFESETLEAFECGDPVTFNYAGSQVTYGKVLSANNRCWLDRNLGATRVATSSTDTQAYGDLFQWGRAADGHEKRNSGITNTLSSSDQPGHGDFILVPDSPLDWRSPRNNNLWQGVNGINNPCPKGFRIPTPIEWEDEHLSWANQNSEGAMNSPLKLPMAGMRLHSDGSLIEVGSLGFYWSVVDDFWARDLIFNSSNTDLGDSFRAPGRSVRCIKD